MLECNLYENEGNETQALSPPMKLLFSIRDSSLVLLFG